MSVLETLCLLELVLQMGVWEAQAGAHAGVERAGAEILYICSGKVYRKLKIRHLEREKLIREEGGNRWREFCEGFEVSRFFLLLFSSLWNGTGLSYIELPLKRDPP